MLFSVNILAAVNITSTNGSAYKVVREDGTEASSHTHVHTAIRNAIGVANNECQEPPCTVYVRQNFELRVVVSGTSSAPTPPAECPPATETVCPDPDPDPDPKADWKYAVLSWNPPTLREDGTAVKVGEIQIYEIDINDGQTVIRLENGETTFTTTPFSPGDYSFKIRCIDIFGLPSDWTTATHVTI